jgi:hypothetical protein
MIRPLQAVNLMHQKMAAMLERMKAAGAQAEPGASSSSMGSPAR